MWPETKKYLQLNPTFDGMRHSRSTVKILGIERYNEKLSGKRISDYLFRRFDVSTKTDYSSDGSLKMLRWKNFHFQIEFFKRNQNYYTSAENNVADKHRDASELAAIFVMTKNETAREESLKILIERKRFSIISEIWKYYHIKKISVESLKILFSAEINDEFFIEYLRNVEKSDLEYYVAINGLPYFHSSHINYPVVRVLTQRFPDLFIVNERILKCFVSSYTFDPKFLEELVPNVAQRMTLKQFLRIIRNWWFGIEIVDGEIFISKGDYRFKLCWPKKN